MSRKPDVPCAACGKLLWGGSSSLPPGQRMCRPCKAAHPRQGPLRPGPPRSCECCGAAYMSRKRQVRTCSPSCGQKMRAKREGHLGRAPRACEVCGDGYKPTYPDQRTCGRACGKKVRQSPPKTTGWPSTRVDIRDCGHCGKVFVARRGRKYCSEECGNPKHIIGRRYHSDTAFRDQVNARAHARRASKLGLGNSLITLTYLAERDRGRCGICRKPVRAKRGPMRPSLDHIVPVSRGGTHALDNVQLAHYRCNLSKNNGGGGEQLLLIG